MNQKVICHSKGFKLLPFDETNPDLESGPQELLRLFSIAGIPHIDLNHMCNFRLIRTLKGAMYRKPLTFQNGRLSSTEYS